MSPSTSVTLRTADVGDIEAIADLFLDCWRTSYHGLLPPHVVAMYGPDDARDLWRRSFAKGPDDRMVTVAEGPDHSIVGVVTTGREPGHTDTGHICSLYVRPDAQGLGLGARLMSAAIERLVADGLSRASLWVFEANADARAFYERLGWLPDGTVRVEPEYGEPELRLTRSLPGPSDPPRARRVS